ncbi:MAG: DUF222 domain-containing protein [Acidimicrobiia bacterium]|nr:DUF222 domain-containing protein [Acidimicrobiia bacterium]
MLTAMRFAFEQASELVKCADATNIKAAVTEVANSVGSGCGAAVCVNSLDVASLSEDGLRSRISSIGQAESKLAAMKSQAIAETSRRSNAVAAERIVCEELRSSKRNARHDVRNAERLAKLPAASEALAAGEITEPHARLIARASSEGPIDERVLVDAAKTERIDDFSKIMRRHQQEMSGDDGMAILEAQRRRRTARMFKSPDTGMFIWNAEFDPTTGQHIASVVAEKERELWNQEDPKNRRTPQQRAADALAELILQPEKGKAKGIALVLVADYDATSRELANARFGDDSPLPMQELVCLALKADIFPAVFDAKTQNLWLGRTRRTATEAQRIALTIRDQGCIGCGTAPNRCFAHHVKFWKHNGPTDYPNLVLVCNDCHHDVHDNGFHVIQDSDTGRWKTQPPPNPFPDTGSTTWQPTHSSSTHLSPTHISSVMLN